MAMTKWFLKLFLKIRKRKAFNSRELLQIGVTKLSPCFGKKKLIYFITYFQTVTCNTFICSFNKSRREIGKRKYLQSKFKNLVWLFLKLMINVKLFLFK